MNKPGLRSALRVTALYVLTAGTWVLLSDTALATWTNDPHLLTEWQVYKGWGFVVVTGLLLFVERQWAERRSMRLLSSEQTARIQAQEAQQGLAAVLEQIRANEAALRESQVRYRLVSENTGDVIWLLDLTSGKFTYVSPSVERLRGYTPSQVMAQTLQDALTPESFRRMTENLSQRRAALEAGEAWARIQTHQVDQPRQDGSVVTTEVVTTLLPDDAGRVTQILGVSRNITERKRMEMMLRASQDRYRRIVETAREGIWILDAGGKTTFVNQRMTDMLGCLAGEMLSAPLFAFVDEKSYALAADLLERRRRGISEQHDFRFRRRDGTDLWAIVEASPILDEDGKFAGTLAMVTDITERKQAEEALRKSEQELRLIADNVPALFSHVSADGCYRFVNRRYEERFGIPRTEIVGKHLRDVLGEAAYERVRDHVEAALSGHPVHFEQAIPYARRGTRWVTADYIPDTDEEGKVRGFFSMVTDITERKQAEAALRESEERYHRVSELASDFAGAFRVDEDGTIMREWLTGAYSRITGFQVGQVDTHGVWITLVHPDDMPVAVRHLQTLFSGRPAVCELRIVTASGQVRWLSNYGRPEWDAAQGRVIRIYSASQDITERKRVEEALRESEAKLRTLFEILPAGISILDEHRNIVDLNLALERILDLSKESLLRGDYKHRQYLRSDGSFMPPEEFASHRAWKEQTLVTDVETGIIKEDGTTVWTSVSAAPLPVPGLSVAIVTADITGRKLAEEALREREARLSAIYSVAPIGIGVDVNRVIQEVNDTLCHITGYSREELVGQNSSFLFLTQKDHESVGRAEYRVIAEHRSEFIETRLKRKDGRIIDTLLSAVPLDAADLSQGVIFTVLDITERKQAEQRIQREAARAEALARVAARLNAQLDLDTVLNAVCEETARALAVPASSVILYQPDRQTFTLAAAFGLPEFLEQFRPLPRTAYDRIAPAGDPLIVLPDIQAMPGLVNAELYRRRDIRTTVLARLIRGSDLVGLLIIHTIRQARDFDQSELDLLTAIADQGAQAIANARLLLETRQQREQLRALSARLAAAEEAERRRLARELHDQVGQSLTALSINLNLVRSQLPDTSLKEKQRLDDSLKLVEETAEHIRDVMAELRPAVLDDYGLLAALRWQGERISRFAAVDIVVEGAELSPRLPQATETALFRIAQEALTNVTRHAQASQARITLEGVAGMARLTLADDGIGFDPERPEAGERPRWGLLTMRERIEAVGGRLWVESAPGRGTRVMVEAPLNLPELESR